MHHASGQSLISSHFPLLSSIEALISKKSDLIDSLSALAKDLLQEKEDNANAKEKMPLLLKILLGAAEHNSGRNKLGFRFNVPDTKLFASYTLLTAGPMFYEWLQSNVPKSLPTVKIVEQYIADNAEMIREGKYRCKELSEFLKKNNYPPYVWLDEDGTRIKSSFQYDSRTNQIVGPVLPLSATNGIPILNSFPATSAAMIANHFINGTPADVAYVVMARPMVPSAPSFCLGMFGTDNRFTAEDVSRRHGFIQKELAKYCVTVLGWSADGDSKLLKAMRSHMFPPSPQVPRNFGSWYVCDISKPITMIQDTIHILNKFKTRLLRSSISLSMGRFVASGSHLKILIQNGSKEEHGLTNYDLTKQDKMNFNATMKMCADRVRVALDQCVPSSDATVVYLDLMKKIEHAFLDKSLLPLQRVYNMWYVVFFARTWRHWLRINGKKLEDNFITYNSYLCLEINAHGIVKVITVLRELKLDHLFIPTIMSSQGSEGFFRKARSMSTTQSTVINFTMLEFLHKTKRIEFLLDIAAQMSSAGFVLPREKRKDLLNQIEGQESPAIRHEPLPIDEELREVIMTALHDAQNATHKLGMTNKICPLEQNLGATLDLGVMDDEEEHEGGLTAASTSFSTIDEDDIPLDILSIFPSGNVSFSDDANVVTDPLSKLVAFRNSKGEVSSIRKSTLCWLLTTEGQAISADRLSRVRTQVLQTVSKRHTARKSVAEKMPEISIGDFCTFLVDRRILVGQVLSFKYLSGKSSIYSADTAPSEPPDEGARGIAVLCSWFTVSKDGLLCCTSLKNDYVCMSKYRCTIPSPTFDQTGHLKISSECLNNINLS